MRFQQLGSTGLSVSSISLGTYPLSAAWGGDLDAGQAAVRAALYEGVNFFDTAWAYGRAERLFGQAIAGAIANERESLVLCSKVGLDIEQRPGAKTPFVPNSRPDFLRQCLTKSLTRMSTEYLDVYLIHWYDPAVPIEDVAGTMGEFVAEGLVRAVGVSNYSVAQMAQFHAVTQLGVAQVPYSLFSRQVEVDVLPYLSSIGAGIMGYSALAQGFLTGAFSETQTFPEGDFRSTGVDFQGDRYLERVRAVERMRVIADDLACTVAQLALAWVLADSAHVVPIMGAQVPDHVLASLLAVNVEMSAPQRNRVTEIANSVPEMDFAALVT